MSVKLDKILEAMENFKLESDVALLENETLTDLNRAQTKKIIHESFGFIKTELTKGGILLETQELLKDAWTQAIMEDIAYVPSMEDEGMSTGEMAATGAGLVGAGYGAKVVAPAISRGIGASQKIYDGGYGLKPSIVQGYRAAKQQARGTVINDINAVKDAANAAGQAVGNAGQAVANTAGDISKAAGTGYNVAKNSIQNPNISNIDALGNGLRAAKTVLRSGKVTRKVF